MLALARSRAGHCLVRHARWLCAASDPEKIIANIDESIARAKALVSSEPALAYEPSDFEADCKKGTINVLKLGEVFQSDPEMKKEMMKKGTMINELTKRLATTEVAPIDWAKIQEMCDEIGLPGVVARLKPEYEAIFEKLKATCAEREANAIAEMKASLKAKFEGPDGLIAKGAEMDKKMAAAKLELLADLENLAYEAKNLDQLTVAEILEKNPAWQQAIEEDLKNHNWGSEIPASILEAKGGGPGSREETKAIS